MKRVTVDTTGLPREFVLAALYNAASPRGMGFTHYDPTPMNAAWALRVINERGNDLRHVLHKLNPDIHPMPRPQVTLAFDYVYGRPLKLTIVNPIVDVTRYDEIHGDGVAETVIDIVLARHDPMDDDIMALHHACTRTAALQEWNTLPAEHREAVLASYRAGEGPPDSMDHIIAGILFPTLN